MRPTLHLGLPSGTPDIRWVLSGPMQGFDAIRIVSQIVCVQSLHYVVLALVLPPVLSIFAYDRTALNFQGGAASLPLLLDWREIAGWPITDGGRAWPWGQHHADRISVGEQDILSMGGAGTSDLNDGFGIRYWWEWEAFMQRSTTEFTKINSSKSIAWEGRRLGSGSIQESSVRKTLARNGRNEAYKELGWWYALAQDRSRGWAIVLAWAITGVADVFLLSMLIRRPTHILDHSVTLQTIHLALTWFYTRNFPKSLFYWLVMAAHTGGCVVWAEALSIRRELRVGFSSGFDEEEGAVGGGGSGSGCGAGEGDRHGPDMGCAQGGGERSALLGRSSSTSRAGRPTTHVLFEGDEGDEEVDDVVDHGGEAPRASSGNDKHKRSSKQYNGHAHAHGNETIEMKRMD